MLKRVATTCVATALVMSLAVPAANATPNVQPNAQPNDEAGDTLVDRVIGAAESGEDTPEQLAERLALPADGAGSLVFDEAERISMMVMFAGEPSEATLASVRALGEVSSVQPSFGTATVLIDPSRLAELQALPGVATVIPSLVPTAGEMSAATLAPASSPAIAPAAAKPDGTACGPIPIEADGPLGSAEARAAFGVDGTGVTVGIISDSFNYSQSALSDAAADVASGALPGAGNPCGRTEEVTVVTEASAPRSDEGRAMAQLVHGIAPGAKLLFASAGTHEGEFAQSIENLAAAGASIIVDDISMISELSYQQGLVSQAAAGVRAKGVAYFTSAGNSNASGRAHVPLASWQTTAYRPMACPTWVVEGSDDPLFGKTIDCLDFDPTANDGVETPYDTFFIGDFSEPGSTEPAEPVSLKPVGSIGEPFAGVTTDYEWRFYEVDKATGETKLLAPGMTRFSPYHPNFGGEVEVMPGSEVRMVMVRTGFDAGARNPAVFTMFIRGGDEIERRTHMGDGVTDWVGETTFGHAADGSAVSVGSLHWDEPTKVRGYSSLGPGTLLFEPLNLKALEPSPRLPAPVRVDTPHIVSVDGVQTSFFGEDAGTPGAPEYRFFGTSAAAPNAAAVAALAKSYAPGITGNELTDLALATAGKDVVNLYAPRFDDQNVFGAGRIDAMALLGALPARPAPVPLTLGKATKDQLEVSWSGSNVSRSLPGAVDHYVIELYQGSIAPANAVEASQLAAADSAYTFSGLAADTAYVVRLTPFAAQGVSGEAATLNARTLAAGSGGEGGNTDGGGKNNAGTNGGKGAKDALSVTGGTDPVPWIAGGIGVLVLGAGLAFAGLRRRKPADKLEG